LRGPETTESFQSAWRCESKLALPSTRTADREREGEYSAGGDRRQEQRQCYRSGVADAAGGRERPVSQGRRSRRAAREQRENLAMIRQQAPLISEAAQRRWNVTTVADQSNSSASRAAKDAAARPRRTMMPLGISPHRLARVHRPCLPARKVQFTPPAEAKPEPQQAPGPADQQEDGGSVGGEKRAQGGEVHPFEKIGARRAPDGRHYLQDHKRPGKCLLMLPKVSQLWKPVCFCETFKSFPNRADF
jgi:hypothetical protein